MVRPRSARSSTVRTAAIVIAVVAVLYAAREVFIPLAFAIILTLILAPPVTWLRKQRLPRVPAVFLVMLIFIGLATGTGVVIFNQLVDVLNELPRYQRNIHNKIAAMRAPGKSSISRAAQSVKELGKELAPAPPTPPAIPAPPAGRNERAGSRVPQNQTAVPQPVQIVPEPVNEFQYLREITTPFLGPLAELGIVLIFTVFLLLEQSDLRNRLLRLVGLQQLNVATTALDDATRRVSKYLLMQLAVNCCFGALCAVGLYFIGVPYAALWGAIAAILRIVPYVGAIAAVVLPLGIALAVFDSWVPPMLVFLLFTALELITGNFVEPWLYGVHTGISSLALLLTAVIWAALWGPAGLILSTPLTVCVVVLGRYVPQLSFLHILLGDEQVLEPGAQVYQRLLALDEHEARTIVDSYLTQNSLPSLYDEVLIPALSLAEHDRHKGELDTTREEFLFLSVKEIMSEFSTLCTWEPGSQGANAGGRFLCIPANDEADEISASMLAQVLEQAGCAVISFPLDPALKSMVETLGPNQNDVFCISSLPPFAFARAKPLSRYLREHYPRTKVMIGVWGFPGDTAKAIQRFEGARPDKLVTNLAEAVAFALQIQDVRSSEAIPPTAIEPVTFSAGSSLVRGTSPHRHESGNN